MVRDLVRETRANFSSPLQPKLEDIVVSSTLNDLVTRVILEVIKFVLLKQVIRAHGIAACEQSLE